MKSIASELAFFLRGRARQNLKLLTAYSLFLLVMVLGYAIAFRYLMLTLEGREYTLMAGIYWSITVMTTLGFGDITFHSDLGYLFATIVTISGVIFLLIILPFGMVSLFIAPWIEHRLKHGRLTELPEKAEGHVIIFGINPITRSFIRQLDARSIPYITVTNDYQQMQQLEEEGVKVIFGSPTDVEVYERLRADKARQIVADLSDPENTNICLTVRTKYQTPITVITDSPDHRNLLRIAGADHVVPLNRIIGKHLSTRATTCGAQAHILDSFGNLLIAEIPVHRTPFGGMTLSESAIREKTGLTVIGLWRRGTYEAPGKDSVLDNSALMFLAGTKEQLDMLQEVLGEESDDLIFVLGHGRIGCAVADVLSRKPVPFILVDHQPNPKCDEHVPAIGDATDPKILREINISEAKGVIVATDNDSTNIFLTLNCRHLSPQIRIVARSNEEENVEQLYAAGADIVVSNGSVGAGILNNILDRKELAFLTEGISLFRRRIPDALVGKSIAEASIGSCTGCSVVAIVQATSEPLVSPSATVPLEAGIDLVLIGAPEQEEVFDRTFR